MATAPLLSKVLSTVGEFVTRQQGDWCHEDWEALLQEAGALGVTLNDESKRCLGNMLENARYFYCLAPEAEAPAPVKAAAKPRAKAKPKAR